MILDIRKLETTMRHLPLLALSAASLLLAGCAGFQTSGSPAAPVKVSSSLTGSVFGGQQPITGATVQLWQAGTTGYGTGATPLLANGGVLTSATGNFTFTSYTCTTGTEIYVTATGGNPGNQGGTVNNQSALIAGLGLCENLHNVPFIAMNEVTTVGTVWALSQFMSGTATGVTIGAPTSNTAGLNAAFADINTLVNVGNGQAMTSTASATLPDQEVYALASSLAACVNSTGSGGGGACDLLFGYTTPAGGSAPGNVSAAALNITRNPAVHANDILALPGAKKAFQTTFATANDLTLGVTYTRSGLAAPTAAAIDASGNVFITNSTGNSVTELAHTGAVLSGATGFTAGSLSAPSAIALDSGGNAWIANAGNSTLTKLAAGGTSATVYTSGGLSTPSSVAIDNTGNIWLTNSGNNSVSAFSPAGTALSPNTGYTAAGIAGPIGVVISPR